ncbi:hypothetical protein BYT27DRAFT_7214708 [Phlegmacium glaucopus]|nr:hypothetical protein BYT27DRAFT_7214708 [Phlegmacium glaucopus]
MAIVMEKQDPPVPQLTSAYFPGCKLRCNNSIISIISILGTTQSTMPYVHTSIHYASDQQAHPLATNPSTSCTNDAVMMARDLLNPALMNLCSLWCMSYLPLKATDRFKTTRWTTSDIQTYIHKGFNLTCPQAAPKLVHIYVGGSLDMFNVGHALQLQQAKLALSFVHLINTSPDDSRYLEPYSPSFDQRSNNYVW